MASGDPTFTEVLLEGVAAYLAADPDASIPLVWKATGDYAPTDHAIYVAVAPPASERPLTVVVRAYSTSADPSLSDSVFSIQLDYYGDRRSVVRAVDDAFNHLEGAWGLVLNGGTKVQSATHRFDADLGIDVGGNYRKTSNFDLAVHRPSSHRQ